MSAWLSRLLDALLGPTKQSDVLDQRPRITPDPEQAASLARKFSALAYYPQQADFHRDQVQERLPQ